MNVYTYSEARQSLAQLLEEALRDGMVKITHRDGQSYIITPAPLQSSPLDIDGVNCNITRDDIVSAIHQSRERNL